jgi:CubicO group peptidase (beta-lactamase class C family)
VQSCKDGSKKWLGKTYACKSGWFTMPIGNKAADLTTRQLLGHLAGIAHYSNGVGTPSPPQALCNDPKTNTGVAWTLKYLQDKPLVRVPGVAYSYSTFGFNLAGVVLGQSQKSTFEALATKHVLEPAGMTSMAVDREWLELANRAVGYVKIGDVIVAEGSDDVSWKLPGGGYISTVRDLGRYCRALGSGKLLSESAAKLAWTSQTSIAGKATDYGLGFASGTRKKQAWVGHSGAQQKTLTRMRLYPKERLCIAIMSNSSWAPTKTLLYDAEDITRAALAGP